MICLVLAGLRGEGNTEAQLEGTRGGTRNAPTPNPSGIGDADLLSWELKLEDIGVMKPQLS